MKTGAGNASPAHDMLETERTIRTINGVKTFNKTIGAETLAKRWNIGLETAKKTLNVTTQKGLRNIISPVSKRFKRQPYHRKRIAPGKWYSDTTFYKTKSIINGDTAAQITTNARGYARFVPLQSKAQASDGLMEFINKVGIPELLVTDGSKEQGYLSSQTFWVKLTKKYGIDQSYTEPYSWWQNMAERDIGEIKREIKRYMQRKGSPRRLWAFLGAYVCGKRALTASNIASNQGRTPAELVLGYTPDIGIWMVFDWYDFVYYLDSENKETKLARWLGPAPDHGAGDCYWLLPVSGKPIVRSTVWRIPDDDLNTDVRKTEMKDFDKIIVGTIRDARKREGSEDDMNDTFPEHGDLFDEDLEDQVHIEHEEEKIPDSDEYTPDTYDQYLHS